MYCNLVPFEKLLGNKSKNEIKTKDPVNENEGACNSMIVISFFFYVEFRRKIRFGLKEKCFFFFYTTEK